MSYPQQPWQPQGQPTGQHQYAPGAPVQPGATGWPQYGAAPSQARLTFGTIDQTRVAALVVVISAAIVLIGSLLSLYSVTVTPSGAAVHNNDAPSGTIDIGVGFFDVVPFPPPIVATAIPLFMLLAALTAAPSILSGAPKASSLPAIFAGTSAILAIVLAISNPLPSVDLSGSLAAELSEEVGGQSVSQLIDSVVSVSPGAGLIVAALFGVVGWAAAAVMLFRRPTAGGHNPPSNPYVPPQPNVPPRW